MSRPYEDNPYHDTEKLNTQKILEFVRAYYKEHGIPPTQPDIAEHVTGNRKNAGNLHRLIENLIEEGFLERKGGTVRNLLPAKRPPRRYYYRREIDPSKEPAV